ncbi:hypothetical protein HYE68_000304 [Fusarium pseudograminearum]|nr:hypothetical protein HYE68_000304 [Fusarium pseudograminearum]
MAMDELEEFPMRRTSQTVRFAENLQPSASSVPGRTNNQTKGILRNPNGDVPNGAFDAQSFDTIHAPFRDFSEVHTFADVPRETLPEEKSHAYTFEDLVNVPSGMFSDPARKKLLDLRPFTTILAGYEHTYCLMSGRNFQASVEKGLPDMEDIDEEFNEIWVELQLFWDLLLRMQPNCITSNAEYTGQAVDFLLDLCMAMQLPIDGPGYQVSAARMQIKCFRRRLRRLELLLRTEMHKCGNSIVMLCGCLVGFKRPESKEHDGFWAPVFGNRDRNQPDQADNRAFTVRDVALLLRVEAYFAHFWLAFKKKHGTKVDDFVAAAVESMDDEIKQYIPKHSKNPLRIKREWLNVLLHPSFRKIVVREVNEIVKEASIFYTIHGTSGHRPGCQAHKTA